MKTQTLSAEGGPPSQSLLVEAIVAAGIPDPISARIALHATLAVLGARLMDDEAEALASVLPPELAFIVERSEYDGDFDAESFYARMTFHTRRPLAASKEQADVVLDVLGQVLDSGRRKRVGRALPETIAKRLTASWDASGAVDEREDEDAARRAIPSYGGRGRREAPTSLANGRPGSLHPIADADADWSRRPAHAHSVAKNDHPHEDTKLSSARGARRR